MCDSTYFKYTKLLKKLETLLGFRSVTDLTETIMYFEYHNVQYCTESMSMQKNERDKKDV